MVAEEGTTGVAAEEGATGLAVEEGTTGVAAEEGTTGVECRLLQAVCGRDGVFLWTRLAKNSLNGTAVLAPSEIEHSEEWVCGGKKWCLELVVLRLELEELSLELVELCLELEELSLQLVELCLELEELSLELEELCLQLEELCTELAELRLELEDVRRSCRSCKTLPTY